jgi:hypothetical protein
VLTKKEKRSDFFGSSRSKSRMDLLSAPLSSLKFSLAELEEALGRRIELREIDPVVTNELMYGDCSDLKIQILDEDEATEGRKEIFIQLTAPPENDGRLRRTRKRLDISLNRLVLGLL